MISYYTSQLSKINVTVFNNSESGQSGYDWGHNIDQSTLNQLLADIGTNEENYIVEFSHGINDYKNGATEAQVKEWLTFGLTQLITAKPKVKIILCTPVNTATADRNIVLPRIYRELATELNLPLVDCTVATAVGTIQGNSNYYQDPTHPNKFGSRRIVDFILNKVLPLDVLFCVTIENYDNGTEPPSANLVATLESGYYATDNGYPTVNTAWRRLQSIPVEPNFQIKIVHKGNRNDNIFMNNLGAFISNLHPTITNYERIVTVPSDAWSLRVNISSAGTTYDALNDTPTVEYFNPSLGLYLKVEDIYSGLNLRNIINKFRDGILVDDYGMVGTSGQTLTIDSNNKMKWSV